MLVYLIMTTQLPVVVVTTSGKCWTPMIMITFMIVQDIVTCAVLSAD